LCEFFVELKILFTELGGFQWDSAEDLQQDIDLAFCVKKLVQDNDLLIAEEAISGFKIPLFITQKIIRFCNEVFKLY
jgi:hypothetical protein